jgi:hypothetical protein
MASVVSTTGRDVSAVSHSVTLDPTRPLGTGPTTPFRFVSDPRRRRVAMQAARIWAWS